ncbi:MAG: M1 family metallopeptidase, partial [Candidatus Aminicenantes bacterium]|nr:M1 family metallopeptidase [Candidatus Aminicenantes bacterium]
MVRKNPSLLIAAAVILAVILPEFAWASSPQVTTPASPRPHRPKFDLWVTLDDTAKTLTGREELVWVNPTRDEVPDMLFHLYWNAFKNEDSAFLREAARETILPRGSLPKDGAWGWIEVTSIRLADGTDLGPTWEFVTPDEPPHPGDQTVARVRFPEPVKPGGTVALRIEFRSKIPRTVARSGYYRHSYFIAQWFPKPGVYEEGTGWNCHAYHQNSEFFADFADYTVHITVPESFVVGSSGKQTGVLSDSAAKAKTTTFVQENIHDLAWTADPNFLRIERTFKADEEVTPAEVEETARKLGLTTDEVRLPDVQMILLIRKEHRRQIDRHFKALRMALKYYGLWYGPYPYETVTMVDPPFRTRSGGMEYPTLFTAGTGVITSSDANSPEMVIIHEFGHGYWYGLVANNEFEAAWLDEGINTYSTGRVLATAYGPG